jgi:hypothetical protein
MAAQKLGVQPSDGEWRPARMAAVVLPRGVPDIYAGPRALWDTYERARLPEQRDLAIMLTIWTPELQTIHDRLEAARSWVAAALVRQRRLPVLVVAHNPGLAGSRNDPHVHVMAAARELTPIGWAAFSSLCHDKALHALHAEWRAHLDAWLAS